MVPSQVGELGVTGKAGHKERKGYEGKRCRCSLGRARGHNAQGAGPGGRWWSWAGGGQRRSGGQGLENNEKGMRKEF